MNGSSWRVFRRWVLANSLGWLLGLVFLVGLASLWGLTGAPEVQFMVGLGLGAGVGLAQRRVLSSWLGRSYRWFWASALGMGAPFLLNDVAAATRAPSPSSLHVYVLAGALVTGLWQSLLLRPVVRRAAWWVVASLAGWGIPTACVALADSGRAGSAADVLRIGAILFGGLMMGIVTGPFLAGFLPQSPTASSTG